mmetsp:Transcript_31811/g.98954  ORF Transcript_31811/g.98954 Transcript_31811/m.98954 type:complete len:407 (+) Transcript_31811:3-1223(+)
MRSGREARLSGAPAREALLKLLVAVGADRGVQTPGEPLVAGEAADVAEARVLPLLAGKPRHKLAGEEVGGDHVWDWPGRNEEGLEKMGPSVLGGSVPVDDLVAPGVAIEPLLVALGLAAHGGRGHDHARVVDHDGGVAAEPAAQVPTVANVGELGIAVGQISMRLQTLLLPEYSLLVRGTWRELVLAEAAPGRHQPRGAPVPGPDGGHDEYPRSVCEVGQEQLRQEEVAQVVDREHAVVAAGGLEDPVRLVQQRLVAVPRSETVHLGGVEDQEVHGPQGRGGDRGEAAHGVEVAQVGRQRRSLAEALAVRAEALHVLGGLRSPGWVGAVHDDVCAEAVERQGGLEADAGGAAGHYGRVAVERRGQLHAFARPQCRALLQAPEERQQQRGHGTQAAAGQGQAPAQEA